MIAQLSPGWTGEPSMESSSRIRESPVKAWVGLIRGRCRLFSLKEHRSLGILAFISAVTLFFRSPLKQSLQINSLGAITIG